jgi:hypothetical protein
MWRLVSVVAVGLSVAASSAAATPSNTIPWLPVRPASALANPPLAPPCTAEDLHAHLFLQGATGSLVGGVALLNAGALPCSLLGFPMVAFSGAAAQSEKWQVKKLASSPPPLDVVADPPGSLRALAPGKSAGFELFWSNWCGPGATPTGASGALPDTLMLQLPSHTTIAVPVAHAPRCDAPQYPSVVSIGPFAPAVRHLPESSRLPLRARIVGRRAVKVKPGVSAFLVHRGQLLTYTVALTNTGNTAFHFAHSSCPTYIEEIATTHAQVYVLNCRPVPSIAPHETVLFEMRIVIADDTRAGINSLTWELAPKTYEAPFAPATLRILP